ncbi:hypothetical protein [Lewinella sp. W8]|uniref:hypothetical protein n=1 Tax=Lewinella sp. W8 TaxID=2528208 RepID=UPI00106736BA|nr:hypothetical protein [Lewinella sp. W8]MTB50707.1 hypothetical protein [Lewinella sp. W8]
MEDLKELTEILGDGFLPVGQTKMGRLAERMHRYLRKAEVPSNESAASYLDMDHSKSSFRKVKHHLKLALINGITAIQPQEPLPESRAEAALWSWKRIAVGKMDVQLIPLGVPSDFDPTVLHRKFSLPEASLQLQELITRDRPDKAEEEDNLSELVYHGQKVFAALFHTSFMQNQRESSEKIEAFSREAIEEFSPLKNRFEDERINYNIYAIEAIYYFSIFDYERVLALTEEAITTFRGLNSPNRDRLIQVFELYKIRACLHLERFEEGYTTATRLIEAGVKVALNQALIQELTILLCLRTGHFQEAYDFFRTINLKKYKATLSKTHGETIDIFAGYLQFLIDIGRVQQAPEDTFFRKFRLRKFLNTFSHANKEKSLRNVQIFVLKVTYLVVNHQKEGLWDEVDALQKYLQRHMRGAKLGRSKLFVRSLILLAKKGISKKTVAEAERQYLKKIDELPLGETHQHTFVEIIRYDYLWSIIKDCILPK